MRVKRLGWKEDDTGWWVTDNRSTFLNYEVRKTDRGQIRVRYPHSGWIYFGECPALDDAFNACQKDFDDRIMSAIEDFH